MPNKEELLQKLSAKPIPHNFTMRELDLLMAKCNCKKGSGGRGSAVQYLHIPSNKKLTFDQPHPRKELNSYQIKKVIGFLIKIGECEGGSK